MNFINHTPLLLQYFVIILATMTMFTSIHSINLDFHQMSHGLVTRHVGIYVQNVDTVNSLYIEITT